MAIHNNLNLFYLILLLFPLLLPCRLAQPKLSPEPSPEPTPTPPPSESPGPSGDDDYIEDEIEVVEAILPSESMDPSRPAPGPTSDDDLDDEVDDQEIDLIILPSPSTGPSSDAPSDSSDAIIEFDLSPSLAPSAEPDPLLKKICDSTDYPSVCLVTVSPYLDGEADVLSVLDVAIQAGAQFTKYGQTTAQKLAGNPENTPQLTAVLKECSDSFGKAAESYLKASEALPEHDKSTLNTTLSAAVSSVADCRDANSQDSEMYSISDRLISMTTNCLALTSLID